MKQGYEQFFKSAKNAKSGARPSVKSQAQQKTSAKQKVKEDLTAEEYLRQALKVRDSKGRSSTPRPPLLALGIILAGLGFGGYGYTHPDTVTQFFNSLEVRMLGLAEAAEGAVAAENSAETKTLNSAQVASSDAKAGAVVCPETKGYTEEELSHFNKLNERKSELDLREADLNALEEELHKQKKEIEDRITKLERVREDVSSVLKDRVEIDQQRVNTLVDFYSNMKPKQAAEIFTTLNEDLAVEVLGKMKKKNAADILNLLEPVKARTLSEKFTGYKRR